MKWKTLFLIFLILPVVLAFTPADDFNGRNVRNIYNVPNIYNVTNITASYFYGDGSGLTNVGNKTPYYNYIDLNTTSSPSYLEGRLFYDSDQGALSYYDQFSGTSIQVGKEGVVNVRNGNNNDIKNGQAVYITGSTGQYPTVDLALASSDTMARAIGIATHDISKNSNGKITVRGLVNNVDTSAWAENETLYVSATQSGNLTNVVPAKPNYAIPIGKVLYSHNSNGKILVEMGIDYTNYPTFNQMYIKTNITSNLFIGNASQLYGVDISKTINYPVSCPQNTFQYNFNGTTRFCAAVNESSLQFTNLNISGNLTASGGCTIYPGGSKVCGNSTCSSMYSPSGLVVINSCN